MLLYIYLILSPCDYVLSHDYLSAFYVSPYFSFFVFIYLSLFGLNLQRREPLYYFVDMSAGYIPTYSLGQGSAEANPSKS